MSTPKPPRNDGSHYVSTDGTDRTGDDGRTAMLDAVAALLRS